MRTTLGFASLALGACATLPGPAPQEGGEPRDNRVSIYLGQRNLDEDDYDPVDEQPTLGFEYSRETEGSAIGWEVGLMGSEDDDDVLGVDVEASTGELYGGIRKTFSRGVVQPYVGAGLSWISVDADLTIADDDDSSLGFYAHGGVAFRIAPVFLLGIDLRGLFGTDLELFGEDTDADYGQLALIFAFAF